VLIRKIGKSVIGINRKGLERPLPVTVQAPIAASETDVILDGELVGDRYFAFDMLGVADQDLRPLPYSVRHQRVADSVAQIADPNIRYIPLITVPSEKLELFEFYQTSNEEGVVFKRLDHPYTVGRPSSGGPALKYKFVERATCLVQRHNEQRSIAIALYDDGELIDVGNCTIPANVDPVSVAVGACVEIRYLCAYQGGSLREPVFVGVRTDVEPEECTVSQLKFKKAPVSP
jgi:bifunctional non-homologous end joining protein LigD